MITFKQFITEARSDDKVHHNISVSHLKALVKNSDHGQFRYLIDHKNKLHAAAAHKFIHLDMHPADNEHKGSIRGYVEHSNGELRHHVAYVYSPEHYPESFQTKTENVNHPILDKMHDMGIHRVHHKLDFEG